MFSCRWFIEGVAILTVFSVDAAIRRYARIHDATSLFINTLWCKPVIIHRYLVWFMDGARPAPCASAGDVTVLWGGTSCPVRLCRRCDCVMDWACPAPCDSAGDVTVLWMRHVLPRAPLLTMWLSEGKHATHGCVRLQHSTHGSVRLLSWMSASVISCSPNSK